jgi:prolyl 4-hydroxylase
MAKQLDKRWQDWVVHNIARGCDKRGIIQILLDHEFDSESIFGVLENEPDAITLQEFLKQKTNTSNSVLQSNFLDSKKNTFQAINAINPPFANQLPTNKANLFVIDHFLNEKECQELITIIRSHCRQSTISSQNEPDKAFRTSQTCDLGLLEQHTLVQEIDSRICEYMGIEPERSETIQGQYYQVGQQFKAHTDYFEPNTAEYQKFAGELGQRTWTFMIYLNEVESGGETNFPDLSQEIKPSMGKALVWNSLLSNGHVNPATLHWAKPVIVGEKFVITKWFRTQGILSSDYVTPQRKIIPLFTRQGFKKLPIPKDLFNLLQSFYQENKPNEVIEESDAIGRYIKSDYSQHPASMIEITDEIRANIMHSLTPLLEKWTGLTLEPSAVYGIREYKQGATLAMHVDRVETHQISAILNIAQTVKKDWPLQICDHMGRVHEVIMKPGEMIFYESARLLNGRYRPLEGDLYANIFTHTRPLVLKNKPGRPDIA